MSASKWKPYLELSSSRLIWSESLPSHWKTKRLRNIFEVKKRIAGKLGYDVLAVTKKGLKVKDTTSGEGQLAADYSTYQIVEKGDFAMNHMDLISGFVGLSSQLGVTSPDYRVFSLRDQGDCKEYYLKALEMCYLEKIFFPFGQGASQVGRWRFPNNSFKDFVFPYPPKDEQEKISKFINRSHALIESMVDFIENFIPLLQQKRSSLVDIALKNPDNKEMRLMYAVNQISRPINRVENETYHPLGLYNRGRGVFQKPPTFGIDLGDSDFFYVETDDLILSGQFAWEGAVALADKHHSGCVVSHRYHVLRGKPDLLDSAYLQAFFNTEYGDFILNQNSRGAAGRNRPLNIGSLLKEKIPIPPLETQLEVSRLVYLEREMRIIFEKYTTLLKEYRTALISAAVTGKIDVRSL